MTARSRSAMRILVPRMVVLSSKGQLTLPRALRDQWGIGPGDRVGLRVRNGVLEVRPVRHSGNRPSEEATSR